MPKLYMMIGVPGSGKSTWISQHNSAGTMVASSDAYIDRIAEKENKTYSEVFKDHVKDANAYALQVARQSFELNLDLIWDQTNINPKSRRPKLAMVPDHYEKIAVFLPTPPENELKKRLADRAGKHIPNNIMLGMVASLVPPSKDEGFDKVITV